MMTHVLFDEWLFLEVNNTPGSYGKDEVARNYKSTFKSASVATLGVSSKQLTIESSMMTQKDTLIAQTFGEDHLILQEWLTSNVVQLMAVKKEKIEEIYQYFKPVPVAALVPYQVAVRAFLKTRNLVDEHKAIIFVDDLKTMAVVTIFQAAKFTDARQIAMRDMEYMTGEIRRTWSSYSAGTNVDMKYVLICNNREWLSSFISLKLVTQDEVLHIDVPYPVIEGLKAAKFTNNFILPKELARKKRRALFNRRLTLMFTIVSLLMVGAAIYGVFLFKANKDKMALAEAAQHEEEMKQQLDDAYKSRLIAYLHSIAYPTIDDIYLNLKTHLPYGYKLQEFRVYQTSDSAWRLSALITPNAYAFYGDFLQQGIWKDAILTDEKVNNQIGQRVELALSKQDNHTINPLEDIQQKINRLLPLPQAKLLKSSQYYARFMSRLNHEAETYDLKTKLEILDVAPSIKAEYLGISAIKFKVTFFETPKSVEAVRVFKLINAWQQQFPLRISSIEYKDTHCQIIGGIYGL